MEFTQSKRRDSTSPCLTPDNESYLADKLNVEYPCLSSCRKSVRIQKVLTDQTDTPPDMFWRRDARSLPLFNANCEG